MKVIALYLPQYHEIKENDEWWGEGYTEWTSLKKGVPYIEGQYQPRVPLNKNYYDLTDINVMRWQAKIAKENGVYGFCFYHYWFNGHKLLEKPLEQYLGHKDIELPYYFCWANETWTRVWEGDKNPKVLIEHNYEDLQDVDDHFYYCLKFFKDPRYMKKNNKPVFSIYNPIAMPTNKTKHMVTRWNELAKKEGFDGIVFMYLCAESMCFMTEKQKSYFDYGVEYQPSYAQHLEDDVRQMRKHYAKVKLSKYLSNHVGPIVKLFSGIKKIISNSSDNEQEETMIAEVKTIRSYDADWESALSVEHDDYSKYIPGGFVDWDNTPRRGRKGKVLIGATPQKFEQYMERLIIRARDLYHSDEIVLFAWNEWSEGGYLEPDEKYGYAYLNALKQALINTNEFPE